MEITYSEFQKLYDLTCNDPHNKKRNLMNRIIKDVDNAEIKNARELIIKEGKGVGWNLNDSDKEILSKPITNSKDFTYDFFSLSIFSKSSKKF